MMKCIPKINTSQNLKKKKMNKTLKMRIKNTPNNQVADLKPFVNFVATNYPALWQECSLCFYMP